MLKNLERVANMPSRSKKRLGVGEPLTPPGLLRQLASLSKAFWALTPG
jgi:hypothetical protein